jgi:orotidine 5'-phosphate decarboxylase subfamily 1
MRQAAETAEDGQRKRRLVVIDAGHGGRDPGARGPGGTREKDITLAVSRRLAAVLRQDPTLEVRMTRDRDTLIALHDRARLANRWRRDGQPALFVSVHANANPSRSEKGYETYFLAEARTADARRVEGVRERGRAVRGETPGAGPCLHPHRPAPEPAPPRVGRRGADDPGAPPRGAPGPDRGVKQAGFAVLRGTFMPAVLVEIGFVSNPSEERLLTTAERQREIAEQLARGIRDFSRAPVILAGPPCEVKPFPADPTPPPRVDDTHADPDPRAGRSRRRPCPRLLDRVGPAADFVKVGLQLFIAEGPPVVRDLRSRGCRVFLDLKLHDIPNTVAHAVRSAAELGVDLLTVHGSGGAAMMRAARDAAGADGPALLAVTVLTSLSAREAAEAWGRDALDAGAEVERLAALAHECGMAGVVASVHELAALRRSLPRTFRVLTPGIRLPGDDAGDQTRVSTPGEAAARRGLPGDRPLRYRRPRPAAALRLVLEDIGAPAPLSPAVR